MVSYAVFLNYNGKRHLEYCLPSFFASSRGKVVPVVVDSGSVDGSQEFLRGNYPGVKLIQLPHNLGWAGGNNVGILYALAKGADYVFVLNTDIKMGRNFFSAIIKAGQSNPHYGVFGCKIRYMDTLVLQAAGGGMLSAENPSGARHSGQDEDDRGQHERVRELDYVYEPAFAVKRGVFEKVGLLDPEWFILMEGADFCLRARRAGFRTVYVPQAVIEHEVSGSTNRKKNKFVSPAFFLRILLAGGRNGLRFMLKHFGARDAIRYQIRAFEDSLLKLPSKPHLLPLQLYGVMWNFVNLPATISRRHKTREEYEEEYRQILENNP